jgi:hypothetical protein
MCDLSKLKMIALLALCFSGTALSQDGEYRYWTDARVNETSRSKEYTANMHNRFPSIKDRYEEGGVYFYSDAVNTFGQREALNPQQEVIFCQPGDKNFSSAVVEASSMRDTDSYSGSGEFRVKDDASTAGLSPSLLELSIRNALQNNANDQTKGRFCYDENDYAGRVDYRNPSSSQAIYCDPNSSSTLDFTDEVSGFGCGLDLDIPLKAGETRFIRQLQEGQPTIAQGFVGCYNNPSTGSPELTLIQNPESCSASSRGECLRTCDWADQVVCSSKDMPGWGGACRAVATQIFKDDSITVQAYSAISVGTSGVRFEGQAEMSCQMVGNQAQWVVTSSSCNPIVE